MKVSINSGFQRGGSLLEWDGREFRIVRRAGENTRADDGDSSFAVDLHEGFRGAVVRFWGRSALSYASSVELVGFTAEELAAPAPVTGWSYQDRSSCLRAGADKRVATMGDYLSALAGGDTVREDADCLAGGKPAPNGDRLVHLSYSAGDQSADGWAVYSPDGKLQRTVCGAGDNTPVPVIQDGAWAFTSAEEDRAEEWARDEAAFYAAKDAGEAFPGGMAEHFRSCYRNGVNPLPTARKRHGGKWTWHKSAPLPVPPGTTAMFTQFASPDGEAGFGWAVAYQPA